MNYPSLSLSADDIERAFSGKNTKSLIKANPVKKDTNFDQYETAFKDGKTRVCDHCDYETSTYEDMFNHTEKRHKRRGLKHKCPECDFSKSAISRVKAHLYQVHLKIGRLKKCDQCDYENLFNNNLYVHKRTHHMEDMKQKCSECDKSYHYQSKLKQHFNQVHLKIRRIQKNYQGHKICRVKNCPDFNTTDCEELDTHSQYFCDQCPFVSQRKDTTDSHIQFAHNGVVFKCDLCTEYTVQTKSALERHMKLKHPGPGQKVEYLVCTEDGCSYKTVAINSDMKRHIREQHEGLKPYNYNTLQGKVSKREDFGNVELLTCEKCGYKTTIHSAWLKHINTHFYLKHVCDECDFSATSRLKMKKHKRESHADQIFSCKEGDFSGKSKEILGQHRMNQHREVKIDVKQETGSIQLLDIKSESQNELRHQDEPTEDSKNESVYIVANLCGSWGDTKDKSMENP